MLFASVGKQYPLSHGKVSMEPIMLPSTTNLLEIAFLSYCAEEHVKVLP